MKNLTSNETTLARYTVELVHSAVAMANSMVEGELPGTSQYKPEYASYFGSISQWNVSDEEAINLSMKMINRRRFGKRRIQFADWYFYNKILPVLNRAARI